MRLQPLSWTDRPGVFAPCGPPARLPSLWSTRPQTTAIEGQSFLNRVVALIRAPIAAFTEPASTEVARVEVRPIRRPDQSLPLSVRLALILKRFLSSVPGMSALIEKMIEESPEYQQWLREHE